MSRPRTLVGWACAVGVLLVAAALLAALLATIGQQVHLVDHSGVPEEVAAASDEYEAGTAVAVLLGVALLGLGAATAVVLRLDHLAAAQESRADDAAAARLTESGA